jgi:predicted ATPase
MLTRLYANNLRCLVAFDTQFDSFGVLCGLNGAGKSSIFDALELIRNLATGVAYLGIEDEPNIPALEFTNWLDSTIQEFELGITSEGHSFEYLLHIEQVARYEKPRIVRERASCDGRSLFERDLKGCAFRNLVTRKQVSHSIGDRPPWHLSSQRETGARSQPSRMHSQNF